TLGPHCAPLPWDCIASVSALTALVSPVMAPIMSSAPAFWPSGNAAALLLYAAGLAPDGALAAGAWPEGAYCGAALAGAGAGAG
ncbi:hypothetical protein E4U42_002111, partial [Claviceps africana]